MIMPSFRSHPSLPTMALMLAALAGCQPDAETATPADRPDPVVALPNEAELDDSTALALAAMPLACLDRPHTAPRGTGYLYERTPALRPNFETTRAFYGCFDWHSAVNSTWALVKILDRFPESRIAPLIAEKLGDHLGAEPLAGELAFFTDNRSFERPYGWAWLLALYAALSNSAHPDAATWAANAAQLAQLFVDRLPLYLGSLDYPVRVGTHANTAFAMDLILDYAESTEDARLRQLVTSRAKALYGVDVDCPLTYEPSASDFLSPCLQEAVLMSRVLEQSEFVSWHDSFLPAADSLDFGVLAERVQLGESVAEDGGLMGAKSHLIGLAFTRAEGLSRLAAALGSEHPSFAAYRSTAAQQAAHGTAAMFEANYYGSHWLGTFALKYLITLQ